MLLSLLMVFDVVMHFWWQTTVYLENNLLLKDLILPLHLMETKQTKKKPKKLYKLSEKKWLLNLMFPEFIQF